MEKDYNIFLRAYPHLDLHGETTFSIVFIIKDFINDNIKLKNKQIVIVHGKGTYALKNKTHELLRENKLVNSFKVDPTNDGQTIVILKC